MAGPPGPGACPWAFFGYFLSQQKVTPRRGGETRQMAFRTERDRTAKGQTGAWQSKKTALLITEALYPESRDRHVQEAALWACLEGQTDKTASVWRSPRLGNGQSRSGRGLSLREYKDGVGDGSCLSQRHIFSRGLCRKKLPHTGEFRPISALRASLRSVALRNAPAGAGGGRPGAVRPGPGPD